MQARKRFGQNFLVDHNTIDRIIAAISPGPHDYIVEIGPGHGALTERLLGSGCTLDAIEIDRDLQAELSTRFPGMGVIGADVLKFDFNTLAEKAHNIGAGKLRVVGNLPYNISTPLLFKLFHHLDMIIDMHFMLQLEVVDRMVAAASSKHYGRLSVMCQYYCDAEKLFAVPPGAFRPQPKVTSAIVRLTPGHDRPRARDPHLLERIVTDAFSQRRKTIRNALKKHLDTHAFEQLALDPALRPENLTLQDYVNCANLITDKRI